MIVFTWTDQSPIGPIRFAATGRGLCRIAFGAEDEAVFHRWVERSLRPDRLVLDRAPFRWLLDQLAVYFAGQVVDFTGPLDLAGTTFQQQVWSAVRAIPFGQTRSYAEIARAIGWPAARRAVGAANAANPLPIAIPCHRVIGQDGSLRGYGGGIALKAWLLRHEGIAISLPAGDAASGRSPQSPAP